LRRKHERQANAAAAVSVCRHCNRAARQIRPGGRGKFLAPLAILYYWADNSRYAAVVIRFVIPGGLLMSQLNESHLDTQVGDRHVDGRPYHFPTLNQDDRIRRVFGLPTEAPLPLVREETLAAYYDYLLANLSLPFDALYSQNGGKMRHLIHYVQVTELLNPRHNRNHSQHGIMGRAQHHRELLELPLDEFGVMEDNPNCELIDDYAYWFVNCR
jgi:hypothetical protein